MSENLIWQMDYKRKTSKEGINVHICINFSIFCC